MAKKAELLAEAKKLKLEVTDKNTITEIQAALEAANNNQRAASEKVETPDTTQSSELTSQDSGGKVATAKAGKRSAKAIAEEEEKEAKEERKAVAKAEESSDKPKAPVKATRSRLERRGKKYRELAKQIDATKLYTIVEALDLATKTSVGKFDGTVEIHVRLGVDPKQADQNIRDSFVLPAGTGKAVRIAVFAEEDVAKEALQAGADIAGADDFLTTLDKGEINFDILIATPSVMARLSKYARVLGPKGLMPNPKSGTVTKDVAKAIAEAKAGRVEYRVDSTGIVHVPVGKVSFGADKLGKNANALLASIKSNKPSSIKGNYVRSITVTTTMGPGIKVAPAELS
jgi:large subunit ribosomal protein L1